MENSIFCRILCSAEQYNGAEGTRTNPSTLVDRLARRSPAGVSITSLINGGKFSLNRALLRLEMHDNMPNGALVTTTPNYDHLSSNSSSNNHVAVVAEYTIIILRHFIKCLAACFSHFIKWLTTQAVYKLPSHFVK